MATAEYLELKDTIVQTSGTLATAGGELAVMEFLGEASTCVLDFSATNSTSTATITWTLQDVSEAGLVSGLTALQSISGTSTTASFTGANLVGIVEHGGAGKCTTHKVRLSYATAGQTTATIAVGQIRAHFKIFKNGG